PEMQVDRPRFRIRLRIIERHLHVEMADVRAFESFCGMECFGMWEAVVVEPTAIVESSCFGDKCVSFPSSDRISKPGRRHICSEFASVHKDLAKVVALLVEDECHPRCLDEVEVTEQHRIRNSMR